MFSRNGTMSLFTFRGIHVEMHWSWFLVAFLLIVYRGYTGNLAIDTTLYLSLFGIVLLHEFGHALACRSVGGQAKRIVLWPLGGVAIVKPPDRPGAHLWSILAGPLVNAVLAPIFLGLAWLSASVAAPVWLTGYFEIVAIINVVLLIFNMLPIYPLDGGQTLMSLLWFVIGKARALRVVSIIGMMAAAAGFLFALAMGNLIWLVLAVFVGFQALQGYATASAMLKLESMELDYQQWLEVLQGRRRPGPPSNPGATPGSRPINPDMIDGEARPIDPPR